VTYTGTPALHLDHDRGFLRVAVASIEIRPVTPLKPFVAAIAAASVLAVERGGRFIASRASARRRKPKAARPSGILPVVGLVLVDEVLDLGAILLERVVFEK
jgi:hypothetical protein